ncbi:MAG: protein translocase subunit SecF [Deltaproteobacteria bacterium]|nr:protein translocase subunit SecF [Deltaproteobacteria bacterium]
MFEFIKPGINLNFVGRRRIAYTVSLILLAFTIISIAARGGLNYGIDFAGGAIIQAKLSNPVPPEKVRTALDKIGLNKASIQQYGVKEGEEYLIQVGVEHKNLGELTTLVKAALEESFGRGQVDIRRNEMVGPKVGETLRQKALLAIYYSILFLMIYISGRFEMKWLMSIVVAAAMLLVTYIATIAGMSVIYLIVIALIVTLGVCFLLRLKYALGAIVATLHDVLMIVGFFSFFNKDIDLSIIAALLTIIGYSLYDTVIVFDRIRENLAKYRKKDHAEIINSSINETLSRTILTSTITFSVVACLFFLGGEVIHDFAFAMMVGIITGTYSSVFVASPILLIWPEALGKAPQKAKSRA